MRRILVLLVATLAITATACKRRGATIYHGIPDGVRVTCRSVNQGGSVYACVGSGKAYTCIEAPAEESENETRGVLECARVSATITPEEPKNDE